MTTGRMDSMPESVIFIFVAAGLIWSSHAGLNKNPVTSVTHGIGFHPLLFRDGGS
jgi:hypothetical protein